MSDDNDDSFPPLLPDDPHEQVQYLRRLQWRHPDEASAVDERCLLDVVRAGLRLCAPLRIRDPREVVRFLALSFLITPAQKRSNLHATVIKRVLLAVPGWRATKRLNFIYTHVVGRRPPETEPDFGVWFVVDPRWLPVPPDALDPVVFAELRAPIPN
jgi:hypothetical protein